MGGDEAQLRIFGRIGEGSEFPADDIRGSPWTTPTRFAFDYKGQVRIDAQCAGSHLEVRRDQEEELCQAFSSCPACAQANAAAMEM